MTMEMENCILNVVVKMESLSFNGLREVRRRSEDFRGLFSNRKSKIVMDIDCSLRQVVVED